MASYLPLEFSQINVGRRSSAREPSTGDTRAGAVTLSVDPSAALATEPPTTAEGEVMDCEACVQPSPRVSKARPVPSRNNFIQQISKVRPAELQRCCKGLGPMHSLG